MKKRRLRLYISIRLFFVLFFVTSELVGGHESKVCRRFRRNRFCGVAAGLPSSPSVSLVSPFSLTLLLTNPGSMLKQSSKRVADD